MIPTHDTRDTGSLGRCEPGRWVPAVLLHVAVVAAGVPLIAGDRWGREDWDYFAQQYEAMRRSVLEYGQIPWWNPWNSGGIPLAGNPQLGLVSIDFACVLWFGTYPGLKLATLLHLLLAAQGAYWLAGRYSRDAWSRAVAGAVYALNGSVALYVAAGHLGIQLVAFIPWVVGLVLRLERGAWWGFALGAVLAVSILGSMQYFAAYQLLIVAAMWLWRCAREPSRRALLWGMAASVVVLIALAGARLCLSAKLIGDFPRGRSAQIRETMWPRHWLIAALVPAQHPEFRPIGWATPLALGWHEYGSYVGLAAWGLFLGSFPRGIRWWHVLAIVCVWLATGNSMWFHPSWWLADWPVWSMFRVASRWRVVAMLGVALGAASVIDRWRASPRIWLRRLASVVAAFVLVDIAGNAWYVHRHAFVVDPPAEPIANPSGAFVQRHVQSPPARAGSELLAPLRSNVGTVYGYEPLIGQDVDPRSSRLWLGHPDYRGEYWSDAGPVTASRWSPNYIELAAPPGAEVFVNQNPGSYWIVNGVRVFEGLRAVDRHAPFRVTADGAGRVILQARPPYLAWAVGVSLCGLLATVILLVWMRVRGDPGHAIQADRGPETAG